MNLLDKIQVFYEADTGNGGSDVIDNQNGESNADSLNTDKNIPYERFKEVNDNYKDVKSQLDTLLQAQAQQELEQKKAQGEFETLYNDLKAQHEPISQEITQYKETFQSILATKLECVPENMRDLIPQGSEFEQLKWIENAQAKGLFKNDNPTSFGNGGANPQEQEKRSSKGFLKGLSRF